MNRLGGSNDRREHGRLLHAPDLHAGVELPADGQNGVDENCGWNALQGPWEVLPCEDIVEVQRGLEFALHACWRTNGDWTQGECTCKDTKRVSDRHWCRLTCRQNCVSQTFRAAQ